jgi:hypothetical protein
MPKKKPLLLDDFIAAGDAAKLLSERLGRPITNRYIHKLSIRAKNPIRSQQIGNRWVYHRGDIESTTIRQRLDHAE